MLLIGDGIIGRIRPRWHSSLWHFGPALANSSIWSHGLDRSNQSSEKAKVMLLSLRQLYGKKLGAPDGDIGHVKDFYFNDQQWAIRYVVADTGSWLSGRLVLIPPHAFGNLRQDADCLLVNLTRQSNVNN
jgi:PRC-barrel domain